MPDEHKWWRDGVLYQIYPRSFADGNGDGVGDLRGVIDRLDHVRWLGVDGIWLNPIMPSPNKDWGYDVSDYKDVDPELGTLDDVDDLVLEATRRDLRVILDLVPNHTSDEHPWFKDAISSRESRYREYYVWADPKPDGSPPNNWLSVFGGESAWELDDESGQYYLHNFLRNQPDLNWWNEDVRNEFDEILRFWFDRGIAGFRIDVAHAIVKDRELRDNLPLDAVRDLSELERDRLERVGQQPIYNMNRPEGHEVLRRWRALADGYSAKRILVGETYVLDMAKMISYYGEDDDELNLAFNFPFIHSDLDSKKLREVVELTESMIPEASWPVWTGSNHDVGRFATRWCEGDERKVRCALMILLTLRGTPFLYYGDEIGMLEPELTRADLKDPVGLRFWPQAPGRDGCRTPMQWSSEAGAGFTDPGVEPWLLLGDFARYNVASQHSDPRSILGLTRALIELRRKTPALRADSYGSLESDDGVWAWSRGEDHVVVVNLSDEKATQVAKGSVILSTGGDRSGERVEETLQLAPWEGAVLER